MCVCMYAHIARILIVQMLVHHINFTWKCTCQFVYTCTSDNTYAYMSHLNIRAHAHAHGISEHLSRANARAHSPS